MTLHRLRIGLLILGVVLATRFFDDAALAKKFDPVSVGVAQQNVTGKKLTPQMKRFLARMSNYDTQPEGMAGRWQAQEKPGLFARLKDKLTPEPQPQKPERVYDPIFGLYTDPMPGLPN